MPAAGTTGPMSASPPQTTRTATTPNVGGKSVSGQQSGPSGCAAVPVISTPHVSKQTAATIEGHDGVGVRQQRHEGQATLADRQDLLALCSVLPSLGQGLGNTARVACRFSRPP